MLAGGGDALHRQKSIHRTAGIRAVLRLLPGLRNDELRV